MPPVIPGNDASAPITHKRLVVGLLPVLGSVSALILFAVFVLGSLGILSAVGLAPIARARPALIQGNWLVILFRINMPAGGVEPDALRILSPVDLAIMVLFAVLALSLFTVLRRASRVCTVIAAGLPLAGILVYLAMATAGRSALLTSCLLLSAVILRVDASRGPLALVGIGAGVLLFVGGDLATAILPPPSTGVAALIAAGRVL